MSAAIDGFDDVVVHEAGLIFVEAAEVAQLTDGRAFREELDLVYDFLAETAALRGDGLVCYYAEFAKGDDEEPARARARSRQV